MLRSQLGAGDWGLHCCWLGLCMAVCLCMPVCVRMPVGVRMAVLPCCHLAMLAAVLAARRDVLLHNMPSTDQLQVSTTHQLYPFPAEYMSRPMTC